METKDLLPPKLLDQLVNLKLDDIKKVSFTTKIALGGGGEHNQENYGGFQEGARGSNSGIITPSISTVHQDAYNKFYKRADVDFGK